MIRRAFLIVILASSLQAQELPLRPLRPRSPSPSSSPTPTPAPIAPPRTLRELINSLNDEDVEKALQTLKEGFFDPAKVDDREMKRSALEGLVQRLAPGRRS